VISNAAVVPAATPKTREADGQDANRNSPRHHQLFASLFLLAGDRLGRALARARIGVGALAAHRQTATMTQAAIAAEVHQTLDVDADFTAKIALDQIVAVDDFADLQNFLVATDIGTLFLDRALRIVSYTPQAGQLFNLIPADISRPLAHVTHRITYTNLPADAAQVLDRLTPIERCTSLTPHARHAANASPARTRHYPARVHPNHLQHLHLE
jgi:hypothetical protein